MDYGYIKDDKVFRKSFLDFPEKEIGVVKENEESTIQYFSEKFEAFLKEVEDIKEKIDNQANKGSYLVKVVNLKEALPTLDALGDFEAVHNDLVQIEHDLNNYIAQNRHKNLQIKTALLEELKTVSQSHEWKSASEAVKEIQQKWLKTGAVDTEHKESIEGQFKELTATFFERRSAFYAELEKMMEEKEADYEAFIKKVEKHLLKLNFQEFKKTQSELMAEWKALPKIKPQKHSEYWESFQSKMKVAHQKARKIQQTKKAGSQESEKAKKEFIAKLEGLNEQVVPQANLKELKREWQNLGYAPQAINDKLNDEFQNLTSQISEKQFLNQLLERKAKKGATENEKAKLRVRLLQDLLHRDINEFRTFEENLEKFNTSKGLDGLLDKKLQQQKRKVEVKKELLRQLKSALKG